MILPSDIEQARSGGRIDIVKLATTAGLKVRPIEGDEEGLESVNAYIQYEGDDAFVIYVNPNQSIQRQRFSIAHELGHFIKHKDDIIERKKVDRSSGDSLDTDKEAEADRCAAELLMPEVDVRKHIEELGVDKEQPLPKETIQSLSERYDVSLYAMILRLRELGFYVPYIDVYA